MFFGFFDDHNHQFFEFFTKTGIKSPMFDQNLQIKNLPCSELHFTQ